MRIKTEDFTFQTLAYFKYTQEKVKNEWRRNNESFEILIKVSSKLSLFSTVETSLERQVTSVLTFIDHYSHEIKLVSSNSDGQQRKTTRFSIILSYSLRKQTLSSIDEWTTETFLYACFYVAGI